MSQIFKMVGVLLIGFLVWKGYQRFLAPPSDAFIAYEHFAEAMAREDFDKAKAVATAEALQLAQSAQDSRQKPVLKAFGRTVTAYSVADVVGSVNYVKWVNKSEKTAADGLHVTLQAVQTVCRIPPGVESAYCKWPVDFQHDVTLTKDADGWKVSAFNEVRLTPEKNP